MKYFVFILVHIIILAVALLSYTLILESTTSIEVIVGIVGIFSCFAIAGLYKTLTEK